MDVLCGFYVEDYVEIIFFMEIIFCGESLIIRGWIIGVERFVIERNGFIEFGGIVYIVQLFEELQWIVDNLFDLFILGFIIVLQLIISNIGVVKVKMILI